MKRSRSSELAGVAMILAAGLAVRLWLVPLRWIFSDEGAHLMDGKLVVDGLVPFVDFSARQALYAYLQAGIVAVFGTDYRIARVFVVLAFMGGALAIFLLARRLFDRSVAIVALLAYSFLPLDIMLTTQVHTETWAVLFSALALCTLAGSLDRPAGAGRWILTGLLLSLAFLVRESSLAVAFGIALFLAVYSFREPARLVRQYALLASGFLVPCLVFVIYFSRYLSLGEVLQTPINPLRLVMWHVGRAMNIVDLRPGNTSVLGEAIAAVGQVAGYREGEQTWRGTLVVGREIFQCSAMLAIGFIGSLVFVAASHGANGSDVKRARRSHALLLCWLGGLALVYGYWVLFRGLFYQYTEEFLPALAILFAWALVQAVSRWGFERNAVGISCAFGLYLAGVFWLYHSGGAVDLPRYAAFLVPALLLALLHLPASHRFHRWLVVLAGVGAWLIVASFVPLPISVRKLLKVGVVPVAFAMVYGVTRTVAPEDRRSVVWYAACCVILGVAGYTFANSGRLLDRTYQSGWSPEAVQQVAAYLRANSAPDDEILSGAVIWEFQAGRHPVANMAHPTSLLLSNLKRPLLQRLETQLATRPPRFIVLDGVTQGIYQNVLDLDRVLKDYALAIKVTMTGSPYPVAVYGRRGAR